MNGVGPERGLAYLVSQYPAPSHTFVRREIAELERRGWRIDTASIRFVAGLHSELDRIAQAKTFYVLGAGVFAYLAAHLSELGRHPLRYVRSLALALHHRAPGMRNIVWALFYFAEAIVLADWLRSRGIGHLHNHFANAAAIVGLIASRQVGIGWSLMLHGISETDYPSGLLLAEKVAAADFVACASYFGRAQAMRITDPALWPKLHIVRCGIELDALPLRQPQQDGPLRVLCVGRLSPEKGHFCLLDAMAALDGDASDARLELVGDGPAEAAIKQRIADLGLEHRVTLQGRLDERATLDRIAQADILVLPSFMEGLPVVLMEAMAIGVPVISSRVAGVPELIEHGVSGLLVNPGDVPALTAALARLLDDSELRQCCAREGAAAVAREFAINKAVEPLAGLFSNYGKLG